MKDSELEQIVDTIRSNHQLRSDSIGTHVRLLRSIEIAALREAREAVKKATVTITDDFGYDLVENPALPDIDKLIRDLELK